jgi:hypothetical protein
MLHSAILRLFFIVLNYFTLSYFWLFIIIFGLFYIFFAIESFITL